MSNSNKDTEIRSSSTAIKQDVGKLSETVHHSKSFRRTNPSFDDLPDDVFSEILCRLPCQKQLVRCNCGSKRWHSHVSFLIRDSNFITRFIRLKRDSKTPIVRALLNPEGKEFRVTKVTTVEEEKSLTRSMTGNIQDQVPLTIMTKRFVSCKWKKEPVVVATYNDLVLCQYGKYDYHIYNPYTKQFVALPPPTFKFLLYVAIGFICDLDNCGRRCKVVRIPVFGKSAGCSELKVDIFSSETGVWRESIISFSQQLYPFNITIGISRITYSHNGMLYWETYNNAFVGFDPFMINRSSSNGDDTIDHYKGRIIEFGDNKSNYINCAGMCGGRLRFTGDLDFVSYELPVWELEEEQDERAHDRSGELFLKCKRYSLDRKMFDSVSYTRGNSWLVTDPNDESILYMHNMSDSGHIFRCNIRTREWWKVPYSSHGRDYLFQLTVLPWWPTPVPMIQ